MRYGRRLLMLLRVKNYRPRGLPFAIALLTSIAGCSDIPGYDSVVNFVSPSETSGSDAGEKPQYGDPIQFRIGDRYIFDNPVERWEVVEIKGDRVYWRNESGARQVTGFNPLLPPTEWQSRVNGSGRRLIRDIEGALFPMKVGATTQYRATVTSDRPPFGWEHKWSCRVNAAKKIDSLSGPIETFVVLCGHGEKDVATYYFAPKFGNYVMSRTKQADGQPDKVRNLLSFERADGTVIAGIAQGHKVATLKPKPKAPPAPLAKTIPQSKKVDTASVNPRPASNVGVSEQDVLASIVLATPNFGGKAVPAVPKRPAKTKFASRIDKSLTEPPTPEPAPLAKVSRAVPPPPVPKPAAKPVRTARAVVPRPNSKVLGPRAAARGLPSAPRPRVPVPPPPLAKATVPPVPKPVARAVPSAPRPRVSVPPPPVARSAVPPVPKPIPRSSRVRNVPSAPALAATAMTVHLASFRSEAAAQQGWTALENANGDLLKGLKPEIREIVVEGKGTFFRLHAMPVPLSGVGDLCRKLNSRGVFCTPAG